MTVKEIEKVEEVKKENSIWQEFMIAYLLFCFFGAIVGVVQAIVDNKCEYDNIVKRTNAGYFVACELLKKRW